MLIILYLMILMEMHFVLFSYNFKFVGATLIPHITKITTQRQSVWENLYALIFYQKMEENTWKKQM